MKFTIIIPCYNSEKWIRQSLLSALVQTHEDTEVIFVDNESTDNSLEIAKQVQSDYPKLKTFTAPNLYKFSWSEPVGEALKHTSGKYFTILGSDDYLAEDYVEKIVKIVSKNTDRIKLLQSPILGVKGDNQGFSGEMSHSYKNLDEFKQILFSKSPVNTPSMVYSKDLYDDGIIRWNDEDYLGASDYDLYFNLADNNLFIFPFPEWLGYYYRWHSEQATWGMHKEKVDYVKKIREKWGNKWKI